MTVGDWRELYSAAIIEVDPGLLKTRIVRAEASIVRRLETIKTRTSSDDERQAISDALASLRVLKREVSNWTEPKDRPAMTP